MTTNLSANAISGEQFLRNLEDSNLVSAGDLEAAQSLLGTYPNGNALAMQLVSTGKLTAYQAAAVLERRFNEIHIGNYEVLDLLGRGGMGTVFKARHRRMKRIVALKVLARAVAGQAEFVQRFQREVETIAQLNHPNIVMAYDAAEDEIGHYLVMEFVNGRDLASEVIKGGPLSIADAVDFTLQAARGLEYAHARNIIHRDIKPANLLRDGSGGVKVADLGLARLMGTAGTSAVNASLTQAGSVIGTVDYMAPEQALDSTAVDHRADIYSLGCTLYFLIAGQPLYTGTTLMALLLKHRDAPIPSIVAARPETPAEVEAIASKAVAKRPEQRFPTMHDLVQALEAVQPLTRTLTGRPQPARVQPITQAPTDRPAQAPTDQTVAFAGPRPMNPDTPAPSVDTAATASSAVLRRVADLTVVVVEPSRTQAGIVRKFLQQIGIDQIHTTGAGKQAIDLAKQSGAQVIFSAMHLSDMTGLQLAQALQADAGCGGVGFILASSAADSDPTGAFGRGARHVLLPKPFDLKQLAHALAVATGRAPEEILPI
jgi:serine/threonine protein kinase